MDQFHWFTNPVLDQYADFAGRASRQQYWMFVLWYVVAYVLVAIVAGISDLGFLVFAFPLGVFVPSLAIGARRLHDVGMSGWWQLLLFIPLIGFIIVVVLLARKGDVGVNMYGPDPLQAVPFNPAASVPVAMPTIAPTPTPTPTPTPVPVPASSIPEAPVTSETAAPTDPSRS